MSDRDMYRKLPWTGGNPRQISEIVNNLVEGKSKLYGVSPWYEYLIFLLKICFYNHSSR
jgi:hypothetical protein